jgi:hypothetical protein
MGMALWELWIVLGVFAAAALIIYWIAGRVSS